MNVIRKIILGDCKWGCLNKIVNWMINVEKVFIYVKFVNFEMLVFVVFRYGRNIVFRRLVL